MFALCNSNITGLLQGERTPVNFRPNRGGVLEKWLSAYKSSNISETRHRTKVTIEVEYEVRYAPSL